VAEPGPGSEPRAAGEPRAAVESRWRDEIREVGLLAVLVVGGVLGLAAIATFVPPVEDLFDRLPIAIIVLIGGTAWVLWRITRRPGPP
jgi:UDP-N-acetylglucosamine:LPS N-acetylglucosamine transferase